jgi:hypothetical protein
MIGNNAYGIWDNWRQFGPGAPKSPLFGIWDIEDFTLDGQPHPMLVTEAQGWRRIIFDFPDAAEVQRMDESRTGYDAKVDVSSGALTLIDRKDKNWKASFHFARTGPDRLALDGLLNGQKAVLHLSLLDHKSFQLVTRGFHWIQDYPFNR